MKKLRVTVEGKTYEVTVETAGGAAFVAPAPVAVSAPVSAPAPVVQAPAPVAAPAPKPAAPAGANDVCSPLVGKVVSIAVKVGDPVTEGAQLVTIEAMKMNTHIYAHAAGKVATIHVAPGDGVSEGQALISLA